MKSSLTTMALFLALAHLPVAGPLRFSHAAPSAWQCEHLWPPLEQPWHFNMPNGVGIDRDGYVYVADTGNHRIQKFTKDGQLVTLWGKQGRGEGEFDAPDDIAADLDGFIYASDKFNQRIQKFTANGEFVGCWRNPGDEWFLPSGIASDNRGSLYILNADNKGVYRFTTDGRFIAKWGVVGDGGNANFNGIAVDPDGRIVAADRDQSRIRIYSPDGILLDQWDARGDGPGQLNGPAGIAIGPAGNIYVADGDNDRVQVFSPDGAFLKQWGQFGTGDGAFNSTSGVAVDETGVYVGDWQHQRIQKFTHSGRFLDAWASRGDGNGEFDAPEGVDLDENGNVYVADKRNHRVQVFTPEGRFLRQWGGEGSDQGRFKWPFGLAVGDGVVYVADTGNDRVQIFDLYGEPLAVWNGPGDDADRFDRPSDIALDGNGFVYVADWKNNRVCKFNASGRCLDVWGAPDGDVQFEAPFSLAVHLDQAIYVVDDYYNCHVRVQKLDLDGGLIEQWIARETDPLSCPDVSGIAVDDNGNVYLPDVSGDRILIYSESGIPLGAIGEPGLGPGQLNGPRSVAASPDGRLYVSDSGNNRIQAFKPADADQKIAKAILVAGGGPYPGNHLWDATRTCVNFAYRVLNDRTLSKEKILYLSPDSAIDLDGNGKPDDVNGDATRKHLEEAILEWAADADQLTLYLADHGGSERFRLNDREILSASELGAWLDEFQARTPAEVVVIYDACNAGSFLPALAGGMGRRTVIAGADAGEDAYFITQGAVSFSGFFWTQIFNGESVGTAFRAAEAAIGGVTSFQNPVMVSGTDLNPDELFLGHRTVMEGESPVIRAVCPDRSVSGSNQVELWAEVADDDGISRTWAVIRPTDFRQRSSDKPVIDLPTVELTPTTGDRFEGTFDGFANRGTYTATFYGRDRKGNVSKPVASRISIGAHLLRRAVIVAGASGAPALDDVFFNVAAFAYRALRFQGYGDAEIHFLSSIEDQPHVDGAATTENFSSILTEWSADDTMDLLIYLVGGGGEGRFQLNEDDDLPIAILDAWLDDLQTEIPGPVVVVCDADRAGTFLPLLTPEMNHERFLIAGTPADGQAMFMAGGAFSFSHFFWNGVLNGMTLRRAFEDAVNAISLAGTETAGKPILDDTGNGIGNESVDGVRTAGYAIGAGIRLSGNDPVVRAAPLDTVLFGEPSSLIYAQDIAGAVPVVRVWAVIRPPGDEAAAAVEPAAALPLPGTGNGRYEAVYDGFEVFGDYAVSIYAEDADGGVSTALSFTVHQSLGSDVWEIDDDRNLAVSVNLHSDGPMVRNFHETDRADWYRMMGVKDQFYSIEIENQGPGCRIRMEMMDAQGTPVLVEDTVEGGNMLRHDWKCPSDGVYYIKLTNIISSPKSDSGYHFRLFRPVGPFAGMVKGRVVDAETDEPVKMARIQTNAGASALSRPDGRYLIVQEPGKAKISIAADHYLPMERNGVVVSEGGTTLQDFRLKADDGISDPVSPGRADETPVMDNSRDVGGICFIRASSELTADESLGR